MSIGWLDEFTDEPFRQGAVKVLCHYAQTYSAAHTANMAHRLRHICAFAFKSTGRVQSLTSTTLISYRATLNRTNEYYLGGLRSFLQRWIDLDLPGLEADLAFLLKKLRLRGNIKGEAVQIRCPRKGALTDLEFESLHQYLVDAFEKNALSLDDFVLVALFMATGRRPSQLSDLKSLDLIEARSFEGLCGYVLNVPRRKVRGGGWRKDFKPVALNPELGMAIRSLIESNCSKLQAIHSGFSEAVGKQLALFPALHRLHRLEVDSTAILQTLLSSESLHISAPYLRQRLKSIISNLSVPSERTAAPLRVFPTRLRRTLATRAAREGHGSLIIAELLDHTDDQNARVYTENVPEHVDAINQAVARQLAPLAQAFAGILVDMESQAERGGDASSRVRTDNGSSAGTCGHYGFCGACAPIACYTCRHFQPWLDGAHHEVLDVLHSEHDRILRITQDPQMAAINNRTILAVTEVIQRCEARRAETLGLQFLG